MTTTIWTDRSRIETYQRCNRLRWLEYHQNDIGIQPMKKALPLVVGGSVHKGLERLLLGDSEDQAVAAAIADFSLYRSALALDTTETTAMVEVDPASLHAQLIATATDLGMSLNDPSIVALQMQQRNAASEFEDWLWQEQASLVEGLVRAYARRRLRPLLEEFEVLEVEREGDWELAHGGVTYDIDSTGRYENSEGEWSLRFMSRPDALLRSRADNSLYLLSYKTAATWDIRKARDAEHDMQGLSEGVEIERRLGEWWQRLHHGDEDDIPTKDLRMLDMLASMPAPPRILGIRYEYLLKGSRYADKDLSARFGINVWSQRSHLIRKYVATSVPARGAASYSVGDECWSYEWIKDDGSTSKLAWQNWRSRSVWEDGSVKSWIDALDDSQMAMSAFDSTVGQEPREMGWKSRAQALGYTATHPLDEVFPAPMTVYRSDDQLRDWVEQVEAQERRVAESVAEVHAAADEGERRHLLNVHFSMSRKSCEYPSTCSMVKLCFGGDDIRARPLDSGLYRAREPNHQQEKDAAAAELKGER